MNRGLLGGGGLACVGGERSGGDELGNGGGEDGMCGGGGMCGGAGSKGGVDREATNGGGSTDCGPVGGSAGGSVGGAAAAGLNVNPRLSIANWVVVVPKRSPLPSWGVKVTLQMPLQPLPASPSSTSCRRSEGFRTTSLNTVTVPLASLPSMSTVTTLLPLTAVMYRCVKSKLAPPVAVIVAGRPPRLAITWSPDTTASANLPVPVMTTKPPSAGPLPGEPKLRPEAVPLLPS